MENLYEEHKLVEINADELKANNYNRIPFIDNGIRYRWYIIRLLVTQYAREDGYDTSDIILKNNIIKDNICGWKYMKYQGFYDNEPVPMIIRIEPGLLLINIVTNLLPRCEKIILFGII